MSRPPFTLRRKKKRRYHGPISFLRAYLRNLRQYMTTGLLVWIPFFVTLWVAWWVFTKVGGGINTFFKGLVYYINAVAARVPAIHEKLAFEYDPWVGFLMATLLFLTTGFLTRYLVARKIIGYGERILGKIPLISRLYLAVQQIRDVFMTREGAVFQAVVLVEYPRPGLLVVGFITAREHGVVQKACGRDLTAVFVPTTPNPTSGFLLYVPSNELTPLNISIEDAMKLIVSGGAYLPQHHSTIPSSKEGS